MSLLKIESHQSMFKPDTLGGPWINEDSFDDVSKPSEVTTTMEATFENFVISTKCEDYSTNDFAELKPLDPNEYFNSSPDTSFSQSDSISSDESSNSLYKGAIVNNTFIGYSGTPEPVSTTTSSPLSSLVSVKQEESDQYVGAEDIDGLARMIGLPHTNDNPTPDINFTDQITPSLPEPSLTIDDWLMLDENKNELLSSVSSPGLDQTSLTALEGSPTQLPSTTTTSNGEYLSQYHNIHQHVQQTIQNSQLQVFLANSTNNNNSGYLNSLSMPEDTYQKTQPILYNKLTQPQKESLNSCLSSSIKPESLFRNPYYQNKDALPSSTETSNYAVSTTEELLLSKYDHHRYIDASQLGSPDSDLSSTQLGYDYVDYKGKNRARLTKPNKLAIRTEGTKDKPVHHCTICNRGFLNKSNIKVHLRTHTGEKPFRCETCNKAFRQKAHLLKHYQIHKRGGRE